MMKTIRVAAAVIERNNQILIAQRLKGEFAGLWEFPGGKYEPGETGEQTIKREIEEELDTKINVEKLLCTIEHQYESFYLIMDCYICTLVTDNLVLHDHSAVKWINNDERNIDWVPADLKVIGKYNEYLRNKK